MMLSISLTRLLGVSYRLKKSDWVWRTTGSWVKSWILHILRWAERSAESQQHGENIRLSESFGFSSCRWGLWKSFRGRRRRSSWSQQFAVPAATSRWTKTLTLGSYQMTRLTFMRKSFHRSFISLVLGVLLVCTFVLSEVQCGHNKS